MRLLNIETIRFREFQNDEIPPYLVVSHRWSTDEASYKDVLKQRNTESAGYKKVLNFCSFARKLEPMIQWLWMDTVCINQNFSAEVSESINSMWEWYAKATHCIAHLQDVRPLRAGADAAGLDFRESEWFQRGWTLQELLAPRCVIFLTKAWEVIGHRSSSGQHACPVTGSDALDTQIAEITSIPVKVLSTFVQGRDEIPNQSRWVWAANRRTTKPEDTSYCLLGIFDIHMPLIYGEGERNARKRLEQEIVKRDQDLGEPHFGSQFVPHNRPDRPRIVPKNAKAGYSGPRQLDTDIELHRANDPYEAVQWSDRCPLCHLLLLDPVTTSCDHAVCETCFPKGKNTALSLIPLDSGGKASGNAATTNFETSLRCPVCDTIDMNEMFALPNLNLAQKLRTKYPKTYYERSRSVNDTGDPSAEFATFQVGNWHREIRKGHHDWTLFVKPSRTDIIHAVQIELHESFPEPRVTLTRPPYSFQGQGWGYFTVGIVISFNQGYVQESRDEAADFYRNEGDHSTSSSDVQHRSTLKLEWTLDFESFDGKGAMGKCRVKVRRIAMAK